MIQRIGKALLAVVVLSLALVAPAAAQGEAPQQCRGVGRVTAIGSSDFSVETRNGGSYTVIVDGQSTFEDRQGNPGSFGDLQVGGWVAGTCERDAEGALHARRVVLLDGEPPRLDVRAAGEITAIDVGGGTFSLRSRQGEDLAFTVTGDTLFRSRDGSITGLGDLEQGMLAVVLATRQEDGSLVAVVVGAGRRDEGIRVWGRIAETGDGSFSLITRDGARRTFSVDASTVFRSRAGSVDGLEDLRPGMRALVGAQEMGNGDLRAVWVRAGRAPVGNDAATPVP